MATVLLILQDQTRNEVEQATVFTIRSRTSALVEIIVLKSVHLNLVSTCKSSIMTKGYYDLLAEKGIS